ncbi:UNVERIFIED_CONTAM: hypothetical protein GTU68_018173 [Idotea baltica]|nr:hypothetical protein [Idotea baltica]
MELGRGERKPFIDVCGRTVLEHTVAAFAACPEITEVVIVAQAEDETRIRALAEANPAFQKLTHIVPGGKERTDSVRNGVQACSPGLDLVAIHDCARLMIRTETISAALARAAQHGAAVVAVPVVDTLKRSTDGTLAEVTMDRSVLWAAQTPQVFRPVEILELLEKGMPAGTPPTDDAALYEEWVGPIPIVPGESTNLKLTTPTDLEIVRALTSAPAPFRIGLGFDLHPLVEGRPCCLGGIVLPHPTGPAASFGWRCGSARGDGRVLRRGLGSTTFGTLFPDTDPRWKGAASVDFLESAILAAQAKGWRVGNADIVIATEGPRIAPHRQKMRARIAGLLGVEVDAVNVKGKTLEGMGALANGAGVAVQVSCLLMRI